MVIVRDPVDAACSFVQREPVVSARQALRNWIRFYTALLNYHNGFVTATFSQVTSDFGGVIQRINRQFGTSLKVFQHNEANVAACFRAIEARNARRFGVGSVVESRVARPSPERSSNKQDVVDMLKAPELEGLRKIAYEIYARYAAWADDACAV